MPLTAEPRFDVEFEADLSAVEKTVDLVRNDPGSVRNYKKACRAIRRAKVLLLSLERFETEPCIVGGDRLLDLSREVVRIAEAVPRNSAQREEFKNVKSGLTRHMQDLARHLKKW